MKLVSHSVFIAFIFTITTSCGKEDSPDNVLVGEWRMTETHVDNGVVIHEVLGEEEIQTFSYHGTEFHATTTFTENPNLFTSSGYYKYEYTTTFLGTTETIILQSDPLGTGQWSMEGDTLFQIFGGVERAYVILELNESTLRVRQDLNTIEGGLPTTATIFTSFEKN